MIKRSPENSCKGWLCKQMSSLPHKNEKHQKWVQKSEELTAAFHYTTTTITITIKRLSLPPFETSPSTSFHLHVIFLFQQRVFYPAASPSWYFTTLDYSWICVMWDFYFRGFVRFKDARIRNLGQRIWLQSEHQTEVDSAPTGRPNPRPQRRTQTHLSQLFIPDKNISWQCKEPS